MSEDNNTVSQNTEIPVSESTLEEVSTETVEEMSKLDPPPIGFESHLATIIEGQQALSADFEALQNGFDSKIKYDNSKEGVIDTLHKELQTLRLGLHFKILQPMFIDLIAMYDDIGKLTAAQADDNLASFQDTIEEILNRNGVDLFTLSDNTFNGQKQRARRTVKTNEQSLDRTIAERIGKGFRYDERILRPEIVALYRYQEEAS